jgi:uncharacterized protein YerC
MKEGILSLQNSADTEAFVRAFLTETEQIMMGNRLAIALMLKNGATYQEIMRTLQVGMSTITFVKRALEKEPTLNHTLLNALEKNALKKQKQLQSELNRYEYNTWEHFVAKLFKQPIRTPRDL